jgi:hypothetical protein
VEESEGGKFRLSSRDRRSKHRSERSQERNTPLMSANRLKMLFQVAIASISLYAAVKKLTRRSNSTARRKT